jgi:hypothetical protein
VVTRRAQNRNQRKPVIHAKPRECYTPNMGTDLRFVSHREQRWVDEFVDSGKIMARKRIVRGRTSTKGQPGSEDNVHTKVHTQIETQEHATEDTDLLDTML